MSTHYIYTFMIKQENFSRNILNCFLRLLEEFPRESKKIKSFEPVHDKTYNKTYASSEDLDQPAHSRSLIRVLANRMCLLKPPSYPKRDK